MKGKYWFLFGVVVLCAAASSSCRELNPTYCIQHDDDPDCEPSNTMCTTNDQCDGSLPFCKNEVCVQCLTDEDCGGGARPICDNMSVCVGCVDNADCLESDLCLEGGSCANPGDVAYVGGPNATMNTQCTRGEPCQNLNQALMAFPARGIVIVTGEVIDDQLIVLDDRTIDIYGGTGAVLKRSTQGEVLEIKRSARVNLFDLSITSGNTVGDGVEVKDMPGPVVTMSRVKLIGQRGAGALVSAGKLVLLDSLVSNNEEDGVRLTGGTLEIKRSKILNNDGTAGVVARLNVNEVLIESSVIALNACSSGGVSVKNTSTATIRNTIIADNGISNQTVGGIDLQAQNGVIEFSTISNNISVNNVGLLCLGGARLTNNILVNNAFTGTCPVTYSLADTILSGTGNVVGAAQFLDMVDPMGTRYFRIGEMSAARNAADPGASLDLDIDGEPRSDGQKDMGADEYRP